MRASFVGRLGHDASAKDVSGTPALEFSVAEDIGYGEKKETQWVRCTLWGKRSQGGLKDYLTRGQQVVVWGEVKMSQYTKRDGTQGANLECRVEEVKLVGSSGDRKAAPTKDELPAGGEISFHDDNLPF